MKDLLSLFEKFGAENAEINWVYLALISVLIILAWKIMELTIPKAFQSLLSWFLSTSKRRSNYSRYESNIRSFVCRDLENNWLLSSLPSLSKRGLDHATLPDVYEPPSLQCVDSAMGPVKLGVPAVLTKHASFALIGPPGSGKSTLMGMLATAYATDAVDDIYGLKESRLPLFIRLRSIKEKQVLPRIVAQGLTEAGCAVDEVFVNDQLHGGRCIIFLDGLDETTELDRRQWLYVWIKETMAAYPENRFIISCRTVDWEQRRISGLSEVKILGLSNSSVDSLTRKWESQLDQENISARQTIMTALRNQSGNIAELSRNPLFLTLMIILHHHGVALPDKSHEIHEVFLRIMLGEWEDLKNPSNSSLIMESEIEARFQFLGIMSVFLLSSGQQDIDINHVEIKEKCDEALENMRIENTDSAQNYLESIASRSGVIYRKSLGSYSFALRGFQEYLAARSFDESQQLSTIIRHFQQETWKETILWFSAITKNPEELLRAIAAQKKSQLVDAIHISLVIDNAYVNEKTRKKILADVEKNIKNNLLSPVMDSSLVARVIRANPKKWNVYLSEMIETNDSMESRRFAVKCLVAASTKDSLNVLANIVKDSDNEICEIIAEELTDSVLDEAEEILWKLIKKEKCIQVAGDSLTARGPQVIGKCRELIEDKTVADNTKINAATILYKVGGASSINYFQLKRKSYSSELNNYIELLVREYFQMYGDNAVKLYSPETNTMYYTRVKPIIDYTAALIALILALLPLSLIGIAVWVTSPGPVFYRQARMGFGGKSFLTIKFRTMVLAAERDGPQWLARDDPRVTSIGRFLRRTRLDELPQIFNLLKGDMSLVGPRPEGLMYHNSLIEQIPLYYGRLLAKPGLFGLAQLEYDYTSSLVDAQKALTYDLQYLSKCSFLFDLSIILRSLGKAFVLKYKR